MSEPEDRAVEHHFDAREQDIEAPTEDAVEQATPIDPGGLPIEVRLGLEVPEADGVDQATIVEFDDEDY
jgi:hypothetical protein